MSTSRLVSSFIVFNISACSFLRVSPNVFAFSSSTLTPKNLISTRHGNNLVSISNIFSKVFLFFDSVPIGVLIIFSNLLQSRNVSDTSCSAYSATKSYGNLCMLVIGSDIPCNSFALSVRSYLYLLSPK